ncbi:enoyl-CoA hydratase-related protein [Pararhodobacter oceanensis]|uniref:enoyl-CoA hydratase-related protein n=1 Tax=Pararhodobacter oceanensis TaxID=2172121 RepID=UPI003A90B241
MTALSPPPPAGPLRGADAAPQFVQRRTQEGVAVLTMAGPDGNRLGPELIAALARAFSAAWQDDGVRAVVLTARGPDFCAGAFADLPPPSPDPPQVPEGIAALADLCAKIAASPKPLVCALHGRVMSGGLALALAAQALVCDARATMHFPEPRLGRLPPGGGALRLAWRLGAEAALHLLNAPAPLSVEDPVIAPLNHLAPREGLLPAAQAFALHLARHPEETPAPYRGLDNAPAYRAALRVARAGMPRALPAHRQHESALLDVLEAAQLLPPDQALGFDQVHVQDAALSPSARAYAHLSRATRRALVTPESQATNMLSARNSPLLAALTPALAAQLVPGLLRDGVEVTLIDQSRDALAETLEAVAQEHLAMVRDGRMTQAASEQDWQRLSGRLSLDPAHPPALALASTAHLAWLGAGLPEGVEMLHWVEDGADPQQAVNLRPAPARRARLCEIIVQEAAPALLVQQASRLAMRLKLTPLRVFERSALAQLRAAAARAEQEIQTAGAEPPLPPERMALLATINTGARLLREGVSLRPSDIDLTMVLGAGWPQWRGGPMAEGDMIGMLVLRHELRRAAAWNAELWTPDALIEELIQRGKRFSDLN